MSALLAAPAKEAAHDAARLGRVAHDAALAKAARADLAQLYAAVLLGKAVVGAERVAAIAALKGQVHHVPAIGARHRLHQAAPARAHT